MAITRGRGHDGRVVWHYACPECDDAKGCAETRDRAGYRLWEHYALVHLGVAA